MSRTGLLLGLVVLACIAATLFLFSSDLTGQGADMSLRSEGDEESPELLDADDEGRLTSNADGTGRSPRDLNPAPEEDTGPPCTPAEGIFGQVVDGRHRPIEGATVKLSQQPDGVQVWQQYRMPDPPPVAKAVTDENGMFLVGPAPDGMLRLRGEAPGFAPTVKTVSNRGCRVDLVLDEGGALELTVKAQDSSLVAEAHVLHQAGTVVSEAWTDAEGHATFPGLPTGTGTLNVTADGYASIRRNDVAVKPGKTETLTVVLGAPFVLEGKVLDQTDERPLEGVVITVRYPNTPWLKEEAAVTTGEDGTFETTVSAPVNESLDLEATLAGYATRRQWVQLSDTGQGRMQVDIRMFEEVPGIEGRVEDYRGHAVGGVRVTYSNRGSMGADVPETKSRSDGSFELAPWAWGTPGSWTQIMAYSPTVGAAVGRTKIPKDGEVVQPVVLKLTGIGAVKGVVRDAAGDPVTGAVVSLTVDWSATMQAAAGGRPDWALLQILGDPRQISLDTVSATDGRYEIPGVPAAGYKVQVSFGLDQVTHDESVMVRPGETVEQDVEIGEGSSIEGWVRDTDGGPVAGAYVRARPDRRRGGRGGGNYVQARSQSDGRFVLHGATADSYSIRASASGFQSNRENGVPPGTTDVELQLKPLGWIEGVVTYNGRPYRGTFSVSAAYVREDSQSRNSINFPGGMRFPGSGMGRTFNTDDGRYVLRNMGAGNYDVTAGSPDGLTTVAAVRVTVVEGRGSEASPQLTDGAVLKGRVVADLTGRPVANASVTVRAQSGGQSGSSSGWGRTDAQGRFQIRGLGSGAHVVQIWPPSGIAFEEPLDLQVGETREIQLRERPPGNIRIVVMDEDGQPIANVSPHVATISGRAMSPNWQAMRSEGLALTGNWWQRARQTDENGVNLRRHLPPGRYQVTVGHRGYGSTPSQWAEVDAGGTSELVFVLPRPQPPPEPPR